LNFLDSKTPAQYLALYIQNQFHGKNADRKSAHASKKYKNPFSQQEAEDYLLTVANNMIMDGVTKYMPESLDIAKFLDDNFGEHKSAFAPAEREDLKKWLDETNDVRVRLCLPRWNQTSFPEFKTEEARLYFKNKKEAMKGPFPELLAKTDEYLQQLKPHLERLADEIIRGEDGKDGVNGKGRVDFDDVLLWPFLVNLTIVKGFSEIAPQKVKNYIQHLAEKSGDPHVPFYQNAL